MKETKHNVWLRKPVLVGVRRPFAWLGLKSITANACEGVKHARTIHFSLCRSRHTTRGQETAIGVGGTQIIGYKYYSIDGGWNRGAAAKLRFTGLGIFRLWHKESFTSSGTFIEAFGDASSNDFELALGSIDRLSSGTTQDRLKLIAEILFDAAKLDVAASVYFFEDLPSLRKRHLRE